MSTDDNIEKSVTMIGSNTNSKLKTSSTKKTKKKQTAFLNNKKIEHVDTWKKDEKKSAEAAASALNSNSRRVDVPSLGASENYNLTKKSNLGLNLKQRNRYEKIVWMITMIKFLVILSVIAVVEGADQEAVYSEQASDCSEPITSNSECEDAIKIISLSGHSSVSLTYNPPGCYKKYDGTYFNTLTSSTTRMRLQTKTRVTSLGRVRVRVRFVQTKTRVTSLSIVSRQ